MSREPKCEKCKWYGYEVSGCYYGGTPNRSDPCLHPDKFVEKILPPHRWGPSPAVWHMVHEKPKGEEISFETRKGKRVSFKKGTGKRK